MSGAQAGGSSIETVAGFVKMRHAAGAVMLKGSTMHTIKPGSIGVMVDDDAPTMWEFLGYRSPSIGHFRNIVNGGQWDRDTSLFWPLIDSLP